MNRLEQECVSVKDYIGLFTNLAILAPTLADGLLSEHLHVEHGRPEEVITLLLGSLVLNIIHERSQLVSAMWVPQLQSQCLCWYLTGGKLNTSMHLLPGAHLPHALSLTLQCGPL